MNTTMANETRHESSVHEQHLSSVRRIGFVDRAALHLGVALIKWGRRPGLTPARERRVNRIELALLHRDRQYAIASMANDDLPTDYVARLAAMR